MWGFLSLGGAMKIPAVQISSLTVGHDRPLIEDMSLDLEQGKVYMLAGLNGSGKTTLLRTIAGLIPALSGRIELMGHQIDTLSTIDRARVLRYQGARSEGGASLRVREVIELGTFANGEVTAIETTAARFSVEHLLERPFNAISDGERQKTLLASVWVQDTPIILLDEPTSFLDFKAKPELLKMIVSMAKEDSKCLMFSSHDLELARPLVDQEVWVDGSNL